MPTTVPVTPPSRSAPLPSTPSRILETPRRRKVTNEAFFQGTKPLTPALQPAALGKRLKKALKLKFEPDPWQLELISRLLRGFDGILCAGTGYGKSLVFEGLAVLAGKGRVVLVISPLKALERDQMQQAGAKGIQAIMINEDNAHESAVWEAARKTAQILYLSPEMSLSDGFAKIWKDRTFHDRLEAVIVDEAHCVEEWGDQSFRGEYRELDILRHYTGQEKPFFACTATCSTATFDFLFDMLAFGFRPFWGLDVGCDRPNLFYDVRAIQNQRRPVLDILDLLPGSLDATTSAHEIPKSLLYFNSEMACREATEVLRKCLPRHLRTAVYAFSSSLSEKAKRRDWDAFAGGTVRILCATDAAGMGCNVPDIRYVIIFQPPPSLSVLAQRWGRAGRDRTTPAVCLLLVPEWAFRPKPPEKPVENPAVARVKGKAKKPKGENKSWAKQRAKLPRPLEAFINSKAAALATDEPGRKTGCLHAALREAFHPDTRLNLWRSLDGTTRPKMGSRSSGLAFASAWTELDLGRTPPAERCCYVCNPDHPDRLKPAGANDPRLHAFARDFVHPLSATPSRPPSSLSVRSAGSAVSHTSSVNFTPLDGEHVVPKAVLEALRTQLQQWRRAHRDPGRDYTYVPCEVDLPDRQIDTLVGKAATFLSQTDVTTRDVAKTIKWDSATSAELEGVASVVSMWRSEAALLATPKSQRRGEKRARRDMEPSDRIPAPVFIEHGGDDIDMEDTPRAVQSQAEGDVFSSFPASPTPAPVTPIAVMPATPPLQAVATPAAYGHGYPMAYYHPSAHRAYTPSPFNPAYNQSSYQASPQLQGHSPAYSRPQIIYQTPVYPIHPHLIYQTPTYYPPPTPSASRMPP